MIYSLKRGEPKKGWVLIVHGLGEHIGRYDKLIDMLVKEGF
ncbi:MAG TPA: alpha/beta hydrolase, partial [Fervidobacterium sp.]|nr:alpha/beta hydrolase [Fervidobacterium sp.]